MSDSDSFSEEEGPTCCTVPRTVAPLFVCPTCEGDIDEGATYYRYLNMDSRKLHTFCRDCFEPDSDGYIEVSSTEVVHRDNFSEQTLDADVPEKKVECDECFNEVHEVCVNYVEEVWESQYDHPYTCDSCLESMEITKAPKLTAESLPTCSLSNELESEVKTMMMNSGAGDQKITIRVFASKQTTTLQPNTKERFGKTGKMAINFPYDQKAIYVFLEINGQDICIFTLFTQEYGNDCPAPNKGKIYIYYMDSVKFLQPAGLRTQLYNEVTITYLKNAKDRGFQSVHFWAYASENGDYVFIRHPQTQRGISQERLVQWYSDLMDKAKERCVISSYTKSIKYPTLPPTEVGYFEGDMWCSDLETYIKDVNEEEQQAEQDGDEFDYSSSLKEKLAMEECDTLFVVVLREDAEVTIQEEAFVPCPFASSRDSVRKFFTKSPQYLPYEFTTERHAHHTTQALIYRLKSDYHTQASAALSEDISRISLN